MTGASDPTHGLRMAEVKRVPTHPEFRRNSTVDAGGGFVNLRRMNLSSPRFSAGFGGWYFYRPAILRGGLR